MNTSHSKRLGHLCIKAAALLLIAHSVVSQNHESSASEVKVPRLPAKVQFIKVKNELSARAILIELRLHPAIVLDNSQYKAFSAVHDSLI